MKIFSSSRSRKRQGSEISLSSKKKEKELNSYGYLISQSPLSGGDDNDGGGAVRTLGDCSELDMAAGTKVFESDEVAEKLLSSDVDPSMWNTKQRRMVKRYQERKRKAADKEDREQDQDQDAVRSSASGAETNGSEDKENPKTAAVEEDGQEAQRAMEVEENENAGHGDTADYGEQGDEGTTTTMQQRQKERDQGDLESKSIGKEIEDDLESVLNRLSSKWRRKLKRQLERGECDEATIRKQADHFLSMPSPCDATPKEKRNFSDAQEQKQENQLEKHTVADEVGTPPARAAESTKSVQAINTETGGAESETLCSKRRKRRKSSNGSIDWGSLPPEERLRREEQRRLQIEASARRKRASEGESSTSATSDQQKQPQYLNSQKRRSNRRPPSWIRKKSGGGSDACNNGGEFVHTKQEHDKSGYQMRLNGSKERVLF